MKGSGKGRNAGAAHASPTSRDVTSETEAKRLVEHLVGLRSDSDMQLIIQDLSIPSCDHCVLYITRKQNQGKSNNREKSIKALLETHIVRPFYSFILLCLQKKILIVSVRLPQRNLNDRIARKAVAVRAKSPAAIESPGTIESGTAGRSEDPERSCSTPEDETGHATESEDGQQSEADAPASQVEVSQMRRSSPRKQKIAKMVVAKTQATSSKKNKKNHAGSDDDDIPPVPRRKAYKTTKSKRPIEDGSSADDAPFGIPTAPDGEQFWCGYY